MGILRHAVEADRVLGKKNEPFGTHKTESINEYANYRLMHLSGEASKSIVIIIPIIFHFHSRMPYF